MNHGGKGLTDCCAVDDGPKPGHGFMRSWVGSVLWASMILVLGGCGNHGGEVPEVELVEGTDVRVEGRVTDVDPTPMAVDGDGLIFVDSELHGAIVVRVPAGERICEAQGLGVFLLLEAGERIRAVGRVNGSGDVTVCASADHSLAKLE